MFQTASGSIRNATTNWRSAFSDLNCSRKSGSFSLAGCRIVNPCWEAYFFTGLSVSFRPRPAGLSGAVTTATILQPAFNNALREATAKSGVPIKTIRSDWNFSIAAKLGRKDSIGYDVKQLFKIFIKKVFLPGKLKRIELRGPTRTNIRF